jgi:hypothetical protein
MLAWRSAIKREASNTYNVKQVSKAINHVHSNCGSIFSTVW